MITTVTTTTVTSFAVAASFSLLLVVALLAILISKEIIGSHSSGKGLYVSKALNVAIVPLALVFAVTVTVRLLETLG